MRVAYARGDPCVVVVLAKEDISHELFARLEVGHLSLCSTEIQDSAPEDMATEVFDVL